MDLLRPFRGPLTDQRPERLARAVPALLYLAMIHVLSSIPGDRIPAPVDDRIEHSLEYFGLAVLLMLFLSGFDGGATAARVAITVAFCSAYGALDEWHQSFVPLRDSSAKDWAFDTIGASIGAIAVLALVRRGARR